MPIQCAVIAEEIYRNRSSRPVQPIQKEDQKPVKKQKDPTTVVLICISTIGMSIIRVLNLFL